MIPSINPKARDITFTFTNSCNCCDDEDPQVYVNSKGEVEKFDPKKAQDEREALKRSISHLRAIIEAKESIHPSRSEIIERNLSESVGEIKEDSPRHLTHDQVKKIKRLIESVSFEPEKIEKELTK